MSQIRNQRESSNSQYVIARSVFCDEAISICETEIASLRSQ
jgi:hypothetical protein